MPEELPPPELVPALAAAETAAPKPAAAALVAEFSRLVQTPGYLQSAFRQMQKDRKYVSEDCMLLKTADTVAVNHVLRNQILSLAYLGVSDPQPFCQPAKTVGNRVAFPVEKFAETSEIHLSREAQAMDLARKLEGAAQDASTNAFAVLKVTLQADYAKDPLGGARFGDQQEQFHEYMRLRELNPDPESADGLKLKGVEQSLRLFVAGQIEEQIQAVPMLVPGPVPVTDPMTGQPVLDPMTLQPVMTEGLIPDPQDPRAVRRKAILDGQEFDIYGCPEVAHYLGFTCEQILPEDYRWDWNVTRPEDMLNADWQAHRVFMTPRAIQAKWHIDVKAIPGRVLDGQRQTGHGGSNSTDQDPSLRTDTEASTVNETVAVWELWNRRLFRRYVFIEGMQTFLEEETPQAVGRRFYPFFFIMYNRVTGQVVAPSDVMLTRHLQDEANMLRSHDREYRRAAFPVVFVPRGLFDKGSREQYRNRKPFDMIEANNAEEISQYIKESSVLTYDPRLCDPSQAKAEMHEMFGLPRAVSGGESGEDLASALALAKEGMETGVARRRIQLNRIVTDIFQWMEEISLKVFSQDDMVKRCGVDAVWPRLTADELLTTLKIEVKGGLSGQPRAKDRMDLWMNFATIAQGLGLMVNGPEVLRQLLDAMGIRVDFSRFIAPMGLPMMPPANAPAMPGGPGGAPPMVDPQRGAPDDLAKVPNHPPLPQKPPEQGA